MSHSIGKGTLKQTLRRDSGQRGSGRQMPREIVKHVVKPVDLLLKRRQRLRPVTSSDEEGSCEAEHARHVPDQFRRCPDSFSRAERTELRRRVPQRLLCAIRQCREKMLEKGSFVIHMSRSSSRNSATGRRVCQALWDVPERGFYQSGCRLPQSVPCPQRQRSSE